MAYQFTQTGDEIQDILDLAQLQIAAPYDAGTSYTAGMYCTKDDGFYVANASTSGTWDGSKWTAVTVGDELASQASDISTNTTNISTLSGKFSFDNCSNFLMGIASNAKPYWRFTDSSGNSHQIQVTASNTLQYLYRASGGTWTIVKTWS